MISHVKFVGIPVRDQDKALQFYTQKLGFKVITDQAMGDQRWIELKIPGGETGVVLFTPKGHEDRIGTFFNGSFATQNIEATYTELREKGVVFDSEPKKEPWGTYAVFRDIDGNQFVLGSK